MFLAVGAFVVAVIVIALAVRGVPRSTSRGPALSGESVAWRNDFSRAFQEAAKAQKPVMVDFYADWCGWCKKLDRDVYANPKVVQASQKFIPVKLNTDKDERTAKRYRIEGLPTIVFFKPDGEEIRRVVGYREPGEFLNEMEQALAAR